MKTLSVKMSDERLKIVAEFLNQNFEALKPLTTRHLPKELEPTSYQNSLSSRHDDES
jgi:hypothetical protein